MPEKNEERANPDVRATLLMDVIVRAGILFLILYWSFQLIRPLLELVLWTIFLTVALYPFYNWIRIKLGNRPIVSATTLSLATLGVVLGPVAVLVSSLLATLSEVTDLAALGESFIPRPPEFIEDIPFIGSTLFRHWTIATTNLEKVLVHYSEYLVKAGSYAAPVILEASVTALLFLSSIILMGYLFIAGPPLIDPIAKIADRVAPGRGEAYVRDVGRTIVAVAQGVIGVSFVQALVGGVLLLIFDVPAAGLFTILALVFGIVQIGVGGVFTPIAIWALFTMPWQYSVPLATGLILVTFIDTFLRPVVMARGLATPAIVMLFGLVGGVALHGPIGLFVGPIVLAVTYELVKRWSEERGA